MTRPTPRTIRSLPLRPDTRMPLVRLVNYGLAGLLLWLAVITWGLSLLMERMPS